MKKLLSMNVMAALPLLAPLAYGAVSYENDFTTRTSKEAIPAYGVWQTAQLYPEKSAFLCYRPSGDSGTYDAASMATYTSADANESGVGRPYIDGWFLPYFNDAKKLVPRYYRPFTGSLSENPVFTWSYGTESKNWGCILHPIHNEFTNGQLRIQVDMKTAVEWGDTECRSSVFPVYRKYMEILAWDGKTEESATDISPGRFGIRGPGSGSSTSKLRSFPFYANNGSAVGTQQGNNDSGSFTDDGSDGKTNYWFRYVVTYDLGNNTFGGEIYRFSKAKGHPSFDTMPSDDNAWQTFSGVTARASISSESGGIAGLGISAYGSFNGANAANARNKTFVDNIRLSWKAPGAADFEVFYENDFTTRRYKTICAPAVSKTGSYSQSTATVNETDTFSGYTATTSTDSNRLAPDVIGSLSVQPVGLDGWRRMPFTTKMNGAPAVVAYGGDTLVDADGTGGWMLTYGNQSGISRLVQTLGTSFTSGRVRIVADMRIPQGGSITTDLSPVVRRLGLGLGSAALYSSERETVLGNVAGGFGYERLAATGASSHKPYTIASGGSNGEPVRSYPSHYVEPTSNCWYRIEVGANLDTKKYDVTVTPLGATSVTADAAASDSSIYTATELDFAAGITDIGSFYLCGYGYGSAASNGANINNRVCWDNIRVYHGSDLVYENDFTNRTRTVTGVTREAGDIAALQYNLDGGQDHWVRRDYTGSAGFDARATVRNDNGNQCLSLGRATEGGRTILLANTLGTSVVQPFRFTADIRPPSQWSATNGTVKVALGDSQMVQTETPESIYGAHRLVSFGFDGTNTQNQTYCPYYFSGCKAKVCGTQLNAEIDATHWYRFRLKVNPETGTCDARLYDMGTAHPAADAVEGTLVASADGLAFEHPLAVGEGISTIHIAGEGLSGAVGSVGIDPAHALLDNLNLSGVQGLVLVFR